ncbi:MAG TPA: RecX family transcriptional regulator [Clostridia bacterium]
MSKITEISVQKKNKSRVNIYLDGEFACGMEAIVALENRLKVGDEISIEELQELSRQSDIESAFSKSLKLLSKTLKTQYEIKNYLIGKGYSLDVIDEVIDKLKSYNYINDKEYAIAYINDKKGSNGKKKIYSELKQKGVSGGILDDALKTISKEEELETIRKLAAKYVKGKTLDLKLKKNLANYLYSRGFEWEDYIDVINELFGDCDDEQSF